MSQCETCRLLRKTKQVHVKCVCGLKDKGTCLLEACFFFLALLIHLLETLNNATANNAALDKEHISKSNDSSPLNGNIC